MVTIRIVSLAPGVHTFDLTPAAEELELDESRWADIRVHVKLERGTDRIRASVVASALATLECDRTLVDFQQPLSGTYAVLFAPPEVVGSGEVAPDDVLPLSPADLEIDLTTVIRDILLLAVPVRCVAPGADELDIPTRFGLPEGDEGVDPRWEALRKLRESGGN